MKIIGAALALSLCCGCALATQGARQAKGETQITVESRNTGDMEVYALCGRHDLVHVGLVPALEERTFSVPAESLVCATGFRFVMVPEGRSNGYVTEPVATTARRTIALFIEKYPGLSDFRVQ